MRIGFIISALITVAVISCSDGGTAVYNQWNNSPVDITAVKERCLTALGMENASISDFEGMDIYQYDTPRPESDYLIPYTVSVGKRIEGAVDRYNSYLTIHNIWSQYELFCHFLEEGYTDAALPVMQDIMGFHSDTLKDEYVRQTIFEAQKELCKEIGSVAFGAQEDNPTVSLDAVTEYMESKAMFNARNEKDQSNAISEQLSWIEFIESPYCKQIDTLTDPDSLATIFYEAMESASSYEEQCRIALSSVGKVPGEIVLPTMRELLTSGHYCHYQFIMWLGWRSAEQYYFFGPSRDAQIADELYNIVRREAFLATLRNYDAHPSDRTTLMVLELFCSTGNIVRDGSDEFNNESVPDFHLVFGY